MAAANGSRKENATNWFLQISPAVSHHNKTRSFGSFLKNQRPLFPIVRAERARPRSRSLAGRAVRRGRHAGLPTDPGAASFRSARLSACSARHKGKPFSSPPREHGRGGLPPAELFARNGRFNEPSEHGRAPRPASPRSPTPSINKTTGLTSPHHPAEKRAISAKSNQTESRSPCQENTWRFQSRGQLSRGSPVRRGAWSACVTPGGGLGAENRQSPDEENPP